MKEEKFNELKDLYGKFRDHEDYEYRQENLAVSPIFREIIQETLKNTPFEQKHLTGLIQVFKINVTNDTFDDYLKQLIPHQETHDRLSEMSYAVEYPGFTGAGLNAVTKLDRAQCQLVKTFLEKAFHVQTIDEACALCDDFESKNIPQVKQGVYSPWLYYINPEIFPILNNSHIFFKNWIGMDNGYSKGIRGFNQIKELVNETDLGPVDMFTHNFEYYLEELAGEPAALDLISYDLQGKRLFKISHGSLFTKKSFSRASIQKYVEENNLICMNRYTGAKQGANFLNKLRVGDLVYLCNGGIKIKMIAEVKSEVFDFDEETSQYFGEDGPDWVYREVEPLFFAQDENLKDLRGYRTMHMPSGNSTFWQVPSVEIPQMNELIFKPYFNVQFSNSSKIDPPINNAVEVVGSFSKRKDNELNTILFGPPGTGKTYETISRALHYLEEDIPDGKRDEQKKRFAELQSEGRLFFTTFHQNMSYEDFIEGIKPQKPKDQEDSLKYVIEDGLFMRSCVEATFDYMVSNFEVFENYREIGQDLDAEVYYEYKKKHVQSFLDDREYEVIENDRSNSFVFIIDEINRGNVSQIFGELITLIEPDKRLGRAETLFVDLPYSKHSFAVPPNLYILGTMNTADRSVEALDTALRRRFSFIPKLPDPGILKPTNDGIELSTLLSKINERLTVLKDSDHTIGHAWFWSVTNLEDLKAVYANKILPLLQEFFYNDYEKLGLVLGNSFFEDSAQVSSSIFAKFSGGNGIAGQYEQVWQYKLKDSKALQVEDFQSLYI
jgi:hypothetical protein